MENYVKETCETGMKYCFESYSKGTEDFDTATASCQSLNTDRRLLNLCEVREYP